MKGRKSSEEKARLAEERNQARLNQESERTMAIERALQTASDKKGIPVSEKIE